MNRAKEYERKFEQANTRYDELSRSTQELNQRFDEFMRAQAFNQQFTRETPSAPTPQVPQAPLGGNTYTPATPSAPPPQTGGEALQRIIQQEVAKQVPQIRQDLQYDNNTEVARTVASQRYSDLGDPNSEFSRQVTHHFERQKQAIESSGHKAPSDLYLTIANEVFIQNQMSGKGSDTANWEERSRQAALSGAEAPPSTTTKSQAKGSGDVDLPDATVRAAQKLGQDPGKLAEFVKKDPYSQQALRMLKEGQ
jgi:hypothetical protein